MDAIRQMTNLKSIFLRDDHSDLIEILKYVCKEGLISIV